MSRAERASKHAASDGSVPVLATRSLRVNQSRSLIVAMVLVWLALLVAAWEGFRLARSEVRHLASPDMAGFEAEAEPRS